MASSANAQSDAISEAVVARTSYNPRPHLTQARTAMTRDPGSDASTHGGGAIEPDRPTSAPAVSVNLQVNGHFHTRDIDPRTSLLDFLRECLSLVGAKKGCDHGQCGACTIHLDGRRVLSCLTPAVQVDG